LRQRLRAAQQLLKNAGWEVQNGVLTETATSRPMQFTITLDQADFQRIVEPYIDNLGDFRERYYSARVSVLR
jgi:microcin C transport system substrate-binding protein